MATVRALPVEWGVATFAPTAQGQSGDRYLICSNQDGVLIAAIDGVGHGEEAANAAKAAVAALEKCADQPFISLIPSCHKELRQTRGVVLSVASIDAPHARMTWLGVGNVQGVLMRPGAPRGTTRETLLLRPGVVGSQLPPLQASALPVANGDSLVFATDGVRADFLEGLSALEAPQQEADRILEQYCRGNDDALVLVVRLTGIRS